ncbi:hypothetical protein [Frankia sp. Cr1]|uniref:hypothetical protein n=1 Tax=Frankia sp. Cr1 TaxID=3073931 RepID=UPI002AD3133D|nr:hypothetical protein [Frankia sp. Cr1]
MAPRPTAPWAVTEFHPANRDAGVDLASANPTHWNVAPDGHPALILAPLTHGHLAGSLLP